MSRSPLLKTLLLTFLLLTIVAVPAARAEYFAVFADGTGPYPNIAAAVAAADEGDIVNLFPGVYSGPGNRDVLVNNDIIIQANDPLWTVTIDCGGSATDPHRAFIVQNSGVQIKYLKIVGGYQEQGGAILSTGSYLELERCEFLSNHATEAGGAVAVDGGWLVSERSIYARNRCDEEGGAIHAQDGAQISLGQNTMVSNGASHGGHVYLTENADLTVDRSLLVFGTGGAAVEDYYSPNITITCTDVFGNQGGDWVYTLMGQMSAGDNKNIDPQMIDPLGPEPDYFFVLGSPVWTGASLCNHLGALTGDLHDGPARYTILPDGTGMFPSIQEAMAEIAPGGIIELDPEPYHLDLDHGPMNPLGHAMTVRTRPNEAGMRATLRNTDIDWWLVLENDEDETTLFEDLVFHCQGLGGGGFKIRGSVGARFVNCEIRNQYGATSHGAVDIENDTGEPATVSFTDCVFTENWAGPCIEADHWNIDLVNCDFLDNDGGSGASALDLRESQGTIRGCQFENNLSVGRGTINIEGSAGQEIRILGGHFIDNTAGVSGGNISLRGEMDLFMDSVIMTGAQAERFGACIYTDTGGNGARVTLADCIFNAPEDGTVLDSGGAINFWYRDVTMSSCVFRNWTVEGVGGAMRQTGGSMDMQECTFEGNQAGSDGGGIYLANLDLVQT
nr:right-handed parallel beta-helix repeat-containing protein [Candidatus Krumholzibacteria bacterium]